MTFDPKSIDMFIPKNQTLFQAIKGDIHLYRRTLHFSKKYKRAFPKMSICLCLVKGQKLAYAEYIVTNSNIEQLVKDLNQ